MPSKSIISRNRLGFKNFKDWHKLTLTDCEKMCDAFQIVEKIKETWEVINNKNPKIIIAGSGMISGGRVS